MRDQTRYPGRALAHAQKMCENTIRMTLWEPDQSGSHERGIMADVINQFFGPIISHSS